MSVLLHWLYRLATGVPYLRPPGAVPESEFLRRCIKCNKCIQICPYHSIVPADSSYGIKSGFPVIHPHEIPCYVCMKCPPVCPTGALDTALKDKHDVAMGLAQIDHDLCLAYNGVICRACFERCPLYREAIVLEDEMFPVVQGDKCIGCGVCENVCPAERTAIRVKSAHTGGAR